jgi:hypothetical protein
MTGHLVSALCGRYLVRGLALSTRLTVAAAAPSREYRYTDTRLGLNFS